MQSPIVANSKKSILQKKGYRDLKDALANPDNVYIGRKQRFVEGTFESKYANPFSVKQYGRDGCLEMYRQYIATRPELIQSLPELSGKTLYCWCCPERCHGDILVELFNSNHIKGSK